jgi:DNA-binding LacI/PurR family transcriptional regulator
VARKERRTAADERLEGLLAAGAWKQARVEARTMAASGPEADRQAAERALVRLRPGPTAVMAFLVGLAFLAVVAVAGLWLR